MTHRTKVIIEGFGTYGVKCTYGPCIFHLKTVSESAAEAKAIGQRHAKEANAKARASANEANKEEP